MAKVDNDGNVWNCTQRTGCVQLWWTTTPSVQYAVAHDCDEPDHANWRVTQTRAVAFRWFEQEVIELYGE